LAAEVYLREMYQKIRRSGFVWNYVNRSTSHDDMFEKRFLHFSS